MGWMMTLDITAGLILLLVIAPIVWLWLRRRWLSSSGGVFDCGLVLGHGGRGTGWSTGVARYRDDRLEWYRTFSLSVRPRVVLTRQGTVALGTREPSPEEAVVLFDDDRILRLQSGARESRVWELAMSQESLTGLLSWLEAAPPGGDSYSGLEHR